MPRYTPGPLHPGPLRETMTIAERRAIARERRPEPPPSATPKLCLSCLVPLTKGRLVCSDACDNLWWDLIPTVSGELFIGCG
jgi:hypothetical protein